MLTDRFRWPWSRALLATLAVAAVANLLLLGLRLWGSGGQTNDVRIEVIGDTVRVLIDGSQTLPWRDPPQERLTVAAPARGSISIGVRPSAPSLPGPRGIDAVRVTDPQGKELLYDDFTFLDEERWLVESGVFAVEDGVLVPKAKGVAHAITLRGAGWTDYIVTVTYRNATAGGIEVRRTPAGGRIAYGFDLVRDFPNFAEVYDDQGAWRGTEHGTYVHTREVGTLKSIAAMLAGAYPLPLLLLAARTRWQAPPAPAFLSTPGRLYNLIAAFATFAAFGLTLHIISAYYSRVPHLPDEAAYMFQAKVFAAGRVTVPVPPVPEAFYIWIPQWLYERDGLWATFYPFGHPLTLAPGALVGAMWLVPPLVGAGNVALIYLVGRRLYDARTAAVAAVVLAASPFFLMQSSNFMSHNTWTFYVLLSLLFLSSGQGAGRGALAGFFFGMAVNTRALEAAVLAPLVGVVLLKDVAGREGRGLELRRAAAFAAGAGVTALMMFAYNAAITGDPLSPAYTDLAADPVIGFTAGHTLDMGLRNQQALLMGLLLVLNGWPQWVGLGLVLLPFLLGTRNRWDYFCLAAAVAVTGVYVLYKWSGLFEGPRYWYQAMPFLALLTARGAEAAARIVGAAVEVLNARILRSRAPTRLAGGLVVYAFLAFLSVDGTGGWLLGWNKAWEEQDVPAVPNDVTDLRSVYLADDSLIRLARQMDLGRALVLVKPCGPYLSLACYDPVFLENDVDFDGEVVWARYIPELVDEVITAFPGRRVYIASNDGGPAIVPYEPTAEAD